jgi:hypothetical protein
VVGRFHDRRRELLECLPGRNVRECDPEVATLSVHRVADRDFVSDDRSALRQIHVRSVERLSRDGLLGDHRDVSRGEDRLHEIVRQAVTAHARDHMIRYERACTRRRFARVRMIVTEHELYRVAVQTASRVHRSDRRLR